MKLSPHHKCRYVPGLDPTFERCAGCGATRKRHVCRFFVEWAEGVKECTECHCLVVPQTVLEDQPLIFQQAVLTPWAQARQQEPYVLYWCFACGDRWRQQQDPERRTNSTWTLLKPEAVPVSLDTRCEGRCGKTVLGKPAPDGAAEPAPLESPA